MKKFNLQCSVKDGVFWELIRSWGILPCELDLIEASHSTEPLFALLTCEDTAFKVPSWDERPGLHQTPVGTLIVDFPASTTMKKKFLWFICGYFVTALQIYEDKC
jgi:hypothetical protein